MCGLSGVLLREGERADGEVLSRMARSMSHRGPDGQGVHLSGRSGLSHRRLAILDLSAAGAQPMLSFDGKVALAFNGEIYNYRELRGELEAQGETFLSTSDTEVILRAFEVWGEESFGRLNGIFAFALVDERSGRPVLHLVRDRFGTKPLFVAQAGGRVAFASEIKPLLGLSWVSRAIDPVSIFRYLKFSHVPSPRTLLEGVSQVPPGSRFRFDAGQRTEIRYVAELPSEDPTISEGEALESLDRCLDRAVERQLASDVPVGCFLSGGIDSSLLAAAAVSRVSRRLQTFSIGYREAPWDETPHARMVAGALGTQHHELIASPSDFFDLIPSIPETFDQPIGDPTLLASLLLSRYARREVTVALSGDGGDELFFGYDYQRVLLGLRPLLAVPWSIRAPALAAAEAVAGWVGSATRLNRAQQARKAFEISQARSEAELFQYFIGTIGPMKLSRINRLLTRPAALEPEVYADLLAGLDGLPWTRKIEEVFQRTFLVDTVLAKSDRAGMAFGLEIRVPFLDEEMAKLAARLPFSLKYRPGASKYLLRQLLRRKLPGAIAERISGRRKQGFGIPLAEWLRGDLGYLLDDCLGEESLRAGGMLVPSEVRKLVREHRERRANHSHLLWSLVCLELWRRRYLA